MALKWGIVGAGKISHDFVTAVKIYPSSDHQIVAIAAKSDERADTFAKDHQIPKSYGNYEKLANDKGVDIVYIGNINTEHFDVTKLMLEHNKNVLCEKPFTMNEKQTKRLIQIAHEKKLFLMEAVWSRCFPVYREMEKLIKSGSIGDVLHASVHFGFPLQHVSRLTKKNMGGGAILDLGVYILQFQQFVFRGLKPIKVVASGHKNNEGTDECAGAILTYPDGKMAVVSTSAKVNLPNEGIVVGTQGTLRIPQFWCPTKLIASDKTYEWELPKSEVEFLHTNSAGLCYEAEEARQCILNGKTESPQMTHEESIELARLMDLLRKEVGVIFPEDNQEF